MRFIKKFDADRTEVRCETCNKLVLVLIAYDLQRDNKVTAEVKCNRCKKIGTFLI